MKEANPRELAFTAVHALPEAKVFRAACLQYARARNRHGANHPTTRDAAEILYHQMFTLYPEARRALSLLTAEED